MGKTCFLIGEFTAVLLLAVSITAKADNSDDEIAFRYESEKGNQSQDVFTDSDCGDVPEYSETVFFSVSSLKKEKAFLFLSANAGEEGEWLEHAGTVEGVYERLFTVREEVFSDEIISLDQDDPKRVSLIREMTELFAETDDPEMCDYYDNEYTLLLKKLRCRVVTEEGEEVECPLSKKTALCFAEKGQERRFTVSINIPEGLSAEERALLRKIHWSLTCEEYNSEPKLTVKLECMSVPENGEYFTPGESIHLRACYGNEGDTDLRYLIARLLQEEPDGRREEMRHDVQKEMKQFPEELQSLRNEGFFGMEFVLTEQDAKNDALYFVTEASAFPGSPEYPERLHAEAGIQIPVGVDEKGGQDEKEDGNGRDPDAEWMSKETGMVLAVLLLCAGIVTLVLLKGKRRK